MTGSSDADNLIDNFLLYSRIHRKVERGTYEYGPFNQSDTEEFFGLHNQFEDLDAIDVAKSWKAVRDRLKEEKESFVLHI